MSIPYATVDRKRGFLSSLGMERSMFYLLVGLVAAMFLMLTILGSDPPAATEQQAVPNEQVETTIAPAISIGGGATN